MTNKEKIIAKIERLKEIGCPLQKGSDYQHGYDEFYTQIKTFINSLPTEQPSEDLEKAATALTNEIVGELNLGDYTDHSGHNAHWHSFKEGVVAGAQWQKEKIINKASQWLNENVVEYHPRKGKLRPIVNINAFRDAMEKEGEQC